MYIQRENNTWERGDWNFSSRVQLDISRMSAGDEAEEEADLIHISKREGVAIHSWR